MNNHKIMRAILPQIFMLQKDVIRLIPNVKPRNTTHLLDELLYAEATRELLLNHPGSSAMNTLDFNLFEGEAEWSRLSYWEAGSESVVLTTIGAKLLIRLFKSGHIEQSRKGSSKDISKLEAYADSIQELEVKSDQIKIKLERDRENDLRLCEKQKARISHLLKHPEDALTEELNYNFLNKYAYAIGPGSRSFEFAEAKVFKIVRGLKTNSGKNSSNYISIHWITSDGVRHGDLDNKPYLNRRNDPNRNFGLGRD
jgi:hypothetical protein